MPAASEQRWIAENPNLAFAIFGTMNPPRGAVAQYVKGWYDQPEQRGLEPDATDTAIYQEFGYALNYTPTVPASAFVPNDAYFAPAAAGVAAQQQQALAAQQAVAATVAAQQAAADAAAKKAAEIAAQQQQAALIAAQQAAAVAAQQAAAAAQQQADAAEKQRTLDALAAANAARQAAADAAAAAALPVFPVAPPVQTMSAPATPQAEAPMTFAQHDAEYAPPVQGDPTHTYIGRDPRGDEWQVVDSAGNVIQWVVNAGDDSRAVLPGTLRNLGPAHSMTVTPPPAAGVSTPGPLRGDPSHVYVRTDSSGDVWKLTDSAGNVLEWSVLPGHDSREVIAGTLVNLGPAMGNASSPSVYTPPVTPASNASVAQATGTATPTNVTPAPTAPAPVAPAVNVPAGTVPSFTQVPRSTQGDPSHVYVGRDTRGDVWQLFDGFSVIEWAVPFGADSRAIIPGTSRNLGPPSAGTIAQQNLPDVPKNATPSVVTPVTVTPPATLSTANKTVGDAPGHTYEGRDSFGNDVWRLVDSAGNAVQWSVLPGHDSREVIAGTLKNLGSASALPAASGGFGPVLAIAGLAFELLH